MNPAVDAHAHLRPNLSPSDVEGIREAFVMAVTRSPGEWSCALRRRDRRIAWGLGCHPGDAEAISSYQETKLAAIAAKASFVGEVGLDARSPVPADRQEAVFRSILHVAKGEGLITSVHSSGRSTQVLDCIEELVASHVILHWWGGSAADTERAIRLGCYFSVNVSMSDDVLTLLPPLRVVTETDFPATSARDRSVNRPGAVGSIERRLTLSSGASVEGLRETEWEAIRTLDRDAGRLARSTATVRSVDRSAVPEA